MHIGGVEYEIRDVRAEVQRKADRHEVHTLSSAVDRLEHSVRELRAENDGLRSRIDELESRLIPLTMQIGGFEQ